MSRHEEKPALGSVRNIKNAASGRKWSVSWESDGSGSIKPTEYRYDIVGPVPYHLIRFVDQSVSSDAKIDFPAYYWEGEYDLTIWPYKKGVGYGVGRTVKVSTRKSFTIP